LALALLGEDDIQAERRGGHIDREPSAKLEEQKRIAVELLPPFEKYTVVLGLVVHRSGLLCDAV